MNESPYRYDGVSPCAKSLIPLYPAVVETGSTELTRGPHDLAACSTIHARELVPHELAKRFTALPISIMQNGDGAPLLVVIVSEEDNGDAVQALRFATGCELISESAPREILERAIHVAYRGGQQSLKAAASKANTVFEAAKPMRVYDEEVIHAAPIPELLSAILDRAIALGASDIHIEPYAMNVRVRYRIDGVLQTDESGFMTHEVAAGVVRRIKVLSQLDHTRTTEPQDGGFSYERDGWSIRLRIASLPQAHGEKVVIRLLHNRFLDDLLIQAERDPYYFQMLGLTVPECRMLAGALGLGSGVIVVCGPTGSGKSTLLYAALNYLNNGARNIATIEDPVERMIPGVNQSEVKRGVDGGYSALLPAILRSDPDIIMLGEIRDGDAAKTIFSAALTGHLALTTVHTGNCLEVIVRLSQLGLDRELMASALRLVVAQKLVPKNCKRCAARTETAPAVRQLFRLSEEDELFESSGCERCRMSGIAGRVGVFELLRVTPDLEQLIMNGAEQRGDRSYRELLLETAAAAGYRPHAFRVRELLIEGVISPTAAMRAIGVAPELMG